MSCCGAAPSTGWWGSTGLKKRAPPILNPDTSIHAHSILFTCFSCNIDSNARLSPRADIVEEITFSKCGLLRTLSRYSSAHAAQCLLQSDFPKSYSNERITAGRLLDLCKQRRLRCTRTIYQLRWFRASRRGQEPLARDS